LLSSFFPLCQTRMSLSFDLAGIVAGAHPILNQTLGCFRDVDLSLALAVEQAGLVQTAASIGLGVDQLKYIICLLLAYPLAFVHRFGALPLCLCFFSSVWTDCVHGFLTLPFTMTRSLPNSPVLKHVFSALTGFAMGFFCFGTGIIHSLITSLVSYLIVW